MHRIRAVAPWLAVPLMLAANAVTGASNDRVTVLTAARIHTMDRAQPRVEAIAYDADGTIVAAGPRAELLARYPSATRVDAGPSTVVPGLIDAHGHVEGLGYTKLRADLVGAASKEEVLARLRAFAAGLPAGAWLLGRGWDQNDWPEQRFPTAADLDTAFPDRPVWLARPTVRRGHYTTFRAG